MHVEFLAGTAMYGRHVLERIYFSKNVLSANFPAEGYPTSTDLTCILQLQHYLLVTALESCIVQFQYLISEMTYSRHFSQSSSFILKMT